MSSWKLALLVLVTISLCSCSSSGRAVSDEAISDKKKVSAFDFKAETRAFQQIEAFTDYEMKLCADVPNDYNPSKVFHKREPGHVFLILTKRNTDSQEVSLVFGFYPRRQASVLIFRNVKSQINDNSERIYDVHIERQLTGVEFQSILDSAIALSGKKYNLNRYNCYDYALSLFNLGNNRPLTPRYIKFPFIAGRGGSPCGIYKDLMNLKLNDPELASQIKFGQLKAPARPERVKPE